MPSHISDEALTARIGTSHAGLEKARKQFERQKNATEKDLKGSNPPSWVAEEAKWDKAKRASRAAFGEVRFAFVTHFYLTVLKGRRK